MYLYSSCDTHLLTGQQASIVLERYRDLVAADRQLIVPVIGSLGEFPLSDAQKRQVLQMTLDAVAIVEGEDVPTIVRVLLASITKGMPCCCRCFFCSVQPTDTAKTIVSTIRSKTADVAVQSHAALLLEIIVNALRLRPYAGTQEHDTCRTLMLTRHSSPFLVTGTVVLSTSCGSSTRIFTVFLLRI